MTSQIDVLTPIHKGIRSMIYSVGAQLQSTDFRDPAQTAAIVRQLQHEFTTALSSGCTLCLLHGHGGDEERFAFPRMAEFDAPLIDHLLATHRELTRRLGNITDQANGLAGLPDDAARVRAGAQLNRTTNEFFAAYISHMNEEEARLVPEMMDRLTDEEMISLRARTQASIPPAHLAEFMAWILPSLNAPELEQTLRGMQRGAPPDALRSMVALAEARVPKERWAAVKQRVGL